MSFLFLFFKNHHKEQNSQPCVCLHQRLNCRYGNDFIQSIRHGQRRFAFEANAKKQAYGVLQYFRFGWETLDDYSPLSINRDF